MSDEAVTGDDAGSEPVKVREVNQQRRYFLIGATSVVAAIGVVGAAVPFVKSWLPSVIYPQFG